MALPLTYPKTAFEVSPRIDLADPVDRQRLSPSALKAFFAIMERWSVKDTDARDLLGGVSNGLYYDMKKNPVRVLETDRLTRVSLLIGIFKSLNMLYPEALADAWMTLANTNRIFAGQTPLTYAISGGVPALLTVRQLLDSRRGGH